MRRKLVAPLTTAIGAHAAGSWLRVLAAGLGSCGSWLRVWLRVLAVGRCCGSWRSANLKIRLKLQGQREGLPTACPCKRHSSILPLMGVIAIAAGCVSWVARSAAHADVSRNLEGTQCIACGRQSKLGGHEGKHRQDCCDFR